MRRFQQRRDRQQPGGGDGKTAATACTRGVQDRRDAARPVANRQQHRCGDQRYIGRACRDELLARRALCRHAIGIEYEQPVQPHARRDPGHDQFDQIARQHQQQHRRQGHAQPAGEGPVARFTVEIGGRIAHHDPPDERHQQGERHAYRIDPRGESGTRQPDHATVDRAVPDQDYRQDSGDQKRQQRRRLRQLRDAARAAGRRDERDAGAQQQRERRGKGQKIERHRHFPEAQYSAWEPPLRCRFDQI